MSGDPTDCPHPNWREKGRIAGIHLALTGLLLIGLGWLVRFHWYPYPYFATDGGREGLWLLTAVGLILGPLLTFIIYAPERLRRHRAQDLGLVAAVQLVALTWVSGIVYNERPVAIVGWQGAFYSTTANIYAAQGISLTRLQTLSPERPPLIYARPEVHPHEYANSLLLMLTQRMGSAGNAVLYQRLERDPEALFRDRPPREALLTGDAGLEQRLADLAYNIGQAQESLVIIPFIGRYGTALLVFSPDGRYYGALLP